MRRLSAGLLAVVAILVFPLAASAAPTSYLPPASHETSARAEWALAGPGRPADTFLSAWTPPSTTWQGASKVKVYFSTGRFTCDTSSDTWTFRWSLGWVEAPRSALSVSSQGATLVAAVPVETRENTGSGCATADRYASPGTLVGEGIATVAAGWDVTGTWESHRSCSLDQAGTLLFVGGSRSTTDASAWMTVGGAVQLSAGADRLVTADLWRSSVTARPNNGQWPCRPA